MAGKTKTRTSKKQLQIARTAEALFTRHGIKRVSVEEVCRKAQVSKMTFYKYFSNKIDLVKHIWRAWIEEGFDKVNEISEMDMPFPEKLERILEYKLEIMSKMSPEFIEELLHTDIHLDEFSGHFMKFIVQAQQRGNIRSEIRPEFFLAAFDRLNELAREDNLRKVYPDLAEFTREIFNFFYYGVLTRPGLEKR